MRLLADQDVYSVTVALLRSLGHDVVTASEIRLSSASDTDVLNAAIVDRRILITRDRDFGSLLFVNAIRAGVIYLRVSPKILRAVHEELQNVLNQYDESELLSVLIVVEAGRHRIRRISAT